MNSAKLSSKNQKKSKRKIQKKKKKEGMHPTMQTNYHLIPTKPSLITDDAIQEKHQKFNQSSNYYNQSNKISFRFHQNKTKQNYQNGGTCKFLTYDFTKPRNIEGPKWLEIKSSDTETII